MRVETDRIEPEVCEAAVIGAGPAGLAAALNLSRALRETVVFDAPFTYRNRDSAGIGGVLGRGGVMPADLRGLGRREIEAYSHARFVDERVERIDGDIRTGFTIETQRGSTTRAAVVLLACGMVDLLPDVPGLSSFWGSTIINCPFCHGYELRGKSWGIFVHRAEMLEAAEIYRAWTDDVTLFIDPEVELSAARAKELVEHGIGIEHRRVRRFVGQGDALSGVELEDGSTVSREAMVLWPRQRHCDVVDELGLAIDADGSVVVDAAYRTSREGLYAAGDLLYVGHQNINTAAHMGHLAASSMVAALMQRATVAR